jgi:hypothetical protein
MVTFKVSLLEISAIKKMAHVCVAISMKGFIYIYIYLHIYINLIYSTDG